MNTSGVLIRVLHYIILYCLLTALKFTVDKYDLVVQALSSFHVKGLS